jgi:hypothetical protein
MSPAEDGARRADERIPVPGNGHRPPMDADVPAPPETATPRREAPAVRLAVTPGQLAVGFGIIASLILLVLGRRRGRRDGG